MREILLITGAVLLGACHPSSSSEVTLGEPEQGRATYYGATGDGACGFGPSPGDLMVTAMDLPEWAGSAVCGECLAVTGPKGKVVVRVVDQCPECEAGHLDLSEEAFAVIADPVAGNVPITWQVQACDVSGQLAYAIKDGSSQWWTAIQIRNSRLPVIKLEWLHAGAWEEIARADYNYFVVDGGVGPDGYQVRVTAVDGRTLTDTLPPVEAGAVVDGEGQF